MQSPNPAAVSAIHLHNAPAGTNGPVVQDIIQDAGGDTAGLALSPEADTGDGDVFVENIQVDQLVSIEQVIGQGGAPITTAQSATGETGFESLEVVSEAIETSNIGSVDLDDLMSGLDGFEDSDALSPSMMDMFEVA